MARASEVQARIHSLEELGSVVGALRTVSAARVQQAHAVLDSVRQYTTSIQDALGEAARGAPLPPTADATAGETPPGVVVVFGSEHGFVGGFNEHALEHAAIQSRPSDQLFVVGARCVVAAGTRGDSIAWSAAMATQVGGIDEVALRVAERLGQASPADLQRVILVFTRSAGGATWRIVTETLLPFDFRPYLPRRLDRPRALSNLPAKALLDGLIGELLFAQLAHAATESFASENAARLSAMEAASDNVDRKLDDLRRLERELRQEEITTELLDVVTGAEAVKEDERGETHAN